MYLLPKECIVYFDHQSLKHFHWKKHMLSRWEAYLERFNYVIVHKSGITNQVVDTLSHRATILVSEKPIAFFSEKLSETR
jgi:hypothetical protein